MSLYSNAAKKAINRFDRAVETGGIVDNSREIGGERGGELGEILAGAAGSIAKGAAARLVNKYVPADIQRKIALGRDGILQADETNMIDAAAGLLRGGAADFISGSIGQEARNLKYMNTPNDGFSGLSPMQAKEIYTQLSRIKFCKSNLFFVEVSSNIGGDFSGVFDMFAVSLDYSPYMLTGDKRKLGAAHSDSLNSSNPVELKMVCMDDKRGSIKQWMAAHSGFAANIDGTVRPQGLYAIEIKIHHGIVNGVKKLASIKKGGQNIVRGTSSDIPDEEYIDRGFFRPASIDFSLDRMNDELSKISLSFVQLDTFM